jgi:CBS domain-containing membrane protein
MHPIVPIAAEIGLAFAIMSYDGKVSICATADAKLVPDAERIGEALAASHMELRAHLGVGKPHTTASNGGPTIADLMSRDVVTVSAGESAGRAWELMRTRRIRHLPVVDARGRVIGLVSHRDLLAASQSSLSFGSEGERVRMLGWAHVADLMETHLSTVNPDESAADAGRRMVRHKIGCLPAVDAEGGLVGIVTEEDFLRWATAHMEPG